MYAILLEECYDAVDGAEVLRNDIRTVNAEVEGDLHVGDKRHDVVGVKHTCFDEVFIATEVVLRADSLQNLNYFFFLFFTSFV